MMTRQHFKAIAAAMAAVKPTCNTAQWDKHVLALADMCARENPRFDRDKFLVACGYQE